MSITQSTILIFILLTLLGLSIGSFLNVCIYRIPSGKSIITPPSSCFSCGSKLQISDLIPLFSFLLLKGRCRYCNTVFSPRYPLVEVLTAILFGIILYKYGLSFSLAKYLFLTALLITVAFIDLDHYIIPNQIVLAGFMAGVIFIPITKEFSYLNALYGMFAASGFLLFLHIISRGGMGMGDIKLAAGIGVFLGWPLSLLALFLACFLAGIAGIFLLISGRKKRKDAIPFGPFISLATFITFIWGWDMITFYRHFILLAFNVR